MSNINILEGTSEEEMADIIFSLNKKAKNIRDEQRDMVYRQSKKITKSNKSKIRNEIKYLKQRKYEYYEQKDLLLNTYFDPTEIHKQTLTTKEYEYVSNMNGVNLDLLMKKTFSKYFAFAFLDEKFQKKMKTVKVCGRDVKTNCYCFNDIIEDESIKESILRNIEYKLDNIVIKGNKIYIPYYTKKEVFETLDIIFAHNLWNGKKIEKPPYFKNIIEFGNIKIARKTNIVGSENKYYLFYKIDNHSFHQPLSKEDLNKYSHLEIKQVELNTKGENVDNLVKEIKIKEEIDIAKTINNNNFKKEIFFI